MGALPNTGFGEGVDPEVNEFELTKSIGDVLLGLQALCIEAAPLTFSPLVW
jgi:hypothetical protein